MQPDSHTKKHTSKGSPHVRRLSVSPCFTSSMLFWIPGELSVLVALCTSQTERLHDDLHARLARCGSTVWLPSSHLRASERQRNTMGFRTPDTSPGTMRSALLSACHLKLQAECGHLPAPLPPRHSPSVVLITVSFAATRGGSSDNSVHDPQCSLRPSMLRSKLVLDLVRELGEWHKAKTRTAAPLASICCRHACTNTAVSPGCPCHERPAGCIGVAPRVDDRTSKRRSSELRLHLRKPDARKAS